MKKQKTIIHSFLVHEDRGVIYECNWAVKADKNKVTDDWRKITCKNCKKFIEVIKNRVGVKRND